MKLIYRVAHISLVVCLSALLIYSVYYAFALLIEDRRPHLPPVDEEPAGPRKPSPQDTARFMNTMWSYLEDWDEEPCIHVCSASWAACRLRHCDVLPHLHRQD
ncbi:uncharacterized protein SETTUDRAFT_20113 [Exserohilum turcica Et28A]|uniref:Uncharacterized protein n=1 Tax=Exserohilum turcicum (strain 28A) TaxID=671987 RepID=R0IHB9_EXST2|nr:uncharacterized protein SETTUDRAFT_20113 [Exserohilum turcica Et28A]EOA84575.1 hypothetical protein SETTUDRAFT_20113 [Exserohilum turcica Et28A]